MKTKKIFFAAIHLFFLNPHLFLYRIFLEFRAFVWPMPKGTVIKEIKGVRFPIPFDEGLRSARSMYFDLYEMGVRFSMQRFLRCGDTFIDVGAKIGYISALAAGFVGITGQIHSFEPVAKPFGKLKKFAEINSEYKIFSNQVALSDQQGNAPMYIAKEGMGYSTMIRDLLGSMKQLETINVPVGRLDSYIEEHALHTIRIIKIDVDGYEFLVLKGLENFFRNTRDLPVIICEICPSAVSLSGSSLDELLQYMAQFSYVPFEVINPSKELNQETIARQWTTNVLFRPGYKSKIIMEHNESENSRYSKKLA